MVKVLGKELELALDRKNQVVEVCRRVLRNSFVIEEHVRCFQIGKSGVNALHPVMEVGVGGIGFVMVKVVSERV